MVGSSFRSMQKVTTTCHPSYLEEGDKKNGVIVISRLELLSPHFLTLIVLNIVDMALWKMT